MNRHILNQSQLKKTGKKTVLPEQNREVFGYCACFVQLEGIIAVVTSGWKLALIHHLTF